jgi:hypothetical protein
MMYAACLIADLFIYRVLAWHGRWERRARQWAERAGLGLQGVWGGGRASLSGT